MEAHVIDVLHDPQPAWRSYVPLLNVNKLNSFLRKHRHRQESLHPWSQSGIVWKGPSRAEQERFATADAIDDFLQNVGTELCDMVGRFRSVKTHFPMLFYIHRLPALERIMRENPALFFAMCAKADTISNQSEAIQFLSDLCRQKHRFMAKVLGFPSDNFLRRVRPEALNAQRIKKLRRIGHDSYARRVFSHLGEAGASVVDLLDSRLRVQFENKFFVEVAESQRDRHYPDIARRADQLSHLLDHCGVSFPHIQSLQHFQRVCASYFQYLDVAEADSLLSTKFPIPPIPEETSYIHAIKTPEQLLIESVKMHNCATSYYREIKDRACYFYQVEKKWGMCRATMQIVRDESDDVSVWRLGAVVGPRNTRIKKSSFNALCVWLASRQGIEDERRVMPRED